MIEIWEKIRNWDGYYISNTGKVKRYLGDPGKFKTVAICPNKNRSNYCYVYHSDSKMRPRALSVHRLVAKYFIPNPENKPCVNHIDNNTQNNNVENLEWVTHKENVAHTIKQGRKVQLKGEDCPHSILTEDTVKKIKEELGTMTHRKLAEKYKTNYSNIAHIKRGSRWGHV